MKKITWSLGALLLSSLLWSGCTTITNLTASSQKRNSSGLYPFEVEFDSRQCSLRKETLQPFVVIEDHLYPMRPTPMLSNRFEAFIEVPPNHEYVNYRFKFNYDYNGIPYRRPGSKLSSPYQLRVTDH